MSWQVEMLWRCTSCSQRNRGRDIACSACGSPKDGSEEYEMPDDVSQGAAVADPSLLAIATGGANWRCGYCQSDQRRRDGACARCGAGQLHASPEARETGMPSTASSTSRVPRRGWSSWSTEVRTAAFAAGVVLSLLFVGIIAVWRRPSNLRHDVVVTGLRWSHTVTTERRMLVDRQGFAESKPADATEVRALGDRFHHDEQVVIGTRPEQYTVQEQDGTTSQSYTAQEACGQTCTSKPQTCKNVCKPNKNGFATCNNVCSGGGQTCSTKYCSVTKTKSVPRYKTVTKTRIVPIYEAQPRYAAWFSWRAWAWVPIERREITGTDNSPRAMSAPSAAAGIEERTSEQTAQVVRFRYEKYSRAECEQTVDPKDFRALAVGMKLVAFGIDCGLTKEKGFDAKPFTAATVEVVKPYAPPVPPPPPPAAPIADGGVGDAKAVK